MKLLSGGYDKGVYSEVLISSYRKVATRNGKGRELAHQLSKGGYDKWVVKNAK